MRRSRLYAARIGAARVLAVFAAIVLGGCAGSSPKKTSGESSRAQVWHPGRPDARGPVVAVVAGRRITRYDVDSVLAPAPEGVKEEYKDPGMYRKLVERMVEQEALMLAAREAGTERDSAFKADLAAQERQLLVKHYYQKVVRSLPAIPDSTVRGYYDAHPSEFKVAARARVRHILLPTQAKAKDVLKRIRSGMTWDQACARFSTDKLTAKNGGVLGYVVSDTDIVPGIGKAPAVVAAALELKEGETSQPLKSERGWHLIRVDNTSPASQRPFEQVEKQIRSNFEGERTEEFQSAFLDSLKKLYDATIFEDSIGAAIKPAGSPAELFQQAQAAAGANERIELFKTLVERYPKDKSAVQAAFMIGFTYAEELGDYPAAREAFRDFLRKYPDSDLVSSANWMLENMEKPNLPPGVGAPADTLDLSPAPGAGAEGAKSQP